MLISRASDSFIDECGPLRLPLGRPASEESAFTLRRDKDNCYFRSVGRWLSRRDGDFNQGRLPRVTPATLSMPLLTLPGASIAA